MPMQFEELDARTRESMLSEFEAEQAGPHPYRGRNLSPTGLEASVALMRQAIETGTEETLAQALSVPVHWNPTESYIRNNVARLRNLNYVQAAERLALTEFNTWYVRGFARRLLDEGVELCQIYRAAQPKWEPASCTQHEGSIYRVRVIYDGHRIRYWPEPGDETAFAIPYEPNCHHSIRRVR